VNREDADSFSVDNEKLTEESKKTEEGCIKPQTIIL
jgi:hypothetical protein